MENRKFETWCRKQWIPIEFEDLKFGDVFRSFEPDGTRVKGIWRAESEVYFCDSGVPGITCIAVKGME